MTELGMTPVLPSFTGFVPMNTTRVLPDAQIVRGTQWARFPLQSSNDSFLEQFDDNFAKLQSSFLSKQRAAYGNVSHIYTLDKYNENSPCSGDLDYLRNVTFNTWKSLKQADSRSPCNLDDTRLAFLRTAGVLVRRTSRSLLLGCKDNNHMLNLDPFSKSALQWRRTRSYYGRQWIWCQVHDYESNMGLYGQLTNITVNATQARESPSLVGYGLTMEGQEGNEIVYTGLLEQTWSATPLDTKKHFHDWVASRYSGSGSIPNRLCEAWELMRTTDFDNTDTSVTSVIKSAFEIRPSLENIRGGFQSTEPTYDPLVVVQAWQKLYQAASSEPVL